MNTGGGDAAYKSKLISKDALSNSDEMLTQFRRYSREPFMDILSMFMEGKPDPLSIKRFASENPDKWANAVGTIARLAGYHDKLEIEQNINIQISQLGDADLLALLEKSEEDILAMTKQGDGSYAPEGEEGTKKDPSTDNASEGA
jgi:hypothetical protein